MAAQYPTEADTFYEECLKCMMSHSKKEIKDDEDSKEFTIFDVVEMVVKKMAEERSSKILKAMKDCISIRR